MTFTLDSNDAFRWVFPAGNDEAFRSLLAEKQTLILAEFFRVADMLDGRESAVRDDIRLFTELPEAAQKEVLLHPASVYWIRASHLRLLHRKRQTDNQPPIELIPFGDFLLAGAILSGAEIETRVETDQRGNISLPGTGITLRLDVQRAELKAKLSHGSDSSTLQIGDHYLDLTRLRADAKTKLSIVEYHGNTIEVNNLDRRFVDDWVGKVDYGSDSTAVVGDGQIAAWSVNCLAALSRLGEINSSLADEASAMLRCIVPVVPPNEAHQLSCSADEFFGSCQASAQGQIELAEEIAHEYRHNALNGLLSVDPFFTDHPRNRTRLYSPWKGTVRPLLGMLHAIYSFQEVLALYLDWLAMHPDDVKRKEQAAIQAARLKMALGEFVACGDLTPFGQAFVEQLQQRVANLVDGTRTVASDLFGLAERQVSRHRERHVS